MLNETIDIFPGGFNGLVAGQQLSELDAATVALITQLQAQVISDPALEAFTIKVYGRLIGETIAHEIGHSLLGNEVGPTGHNVPAIANDLMNFGGDRTFEQRTGLEDTAGVSPIDPANFIDHGIAAIDGLQATNQARMNVHFPVPPSFP